MDASGWMMDRAQVDLVLHSSSSIRWMSTRSSNIKVQLKLTGTEVVSNQPMPPYINHHSHPMDTHRSPLILVIVNMHIPHMHQREAPRCTPCVSPLHPHSGPLAVALKVKSDIIIQGLPSTHSHRTPRDKVLRGLHPRWILKRWFWINRTHYIFHGVGPIPPSATVPLDMRPPSWSAGSKGVATGPSAVADTQ